MNIGGFFNGKSRDRLSAKRAPRMPSGSSSAKRSEIRLPLCRILASMKSPQTRRRMPTTWTYRETTRPIAPEILPWSICNSRKPPFSGLSSDGRPWDACPGRRTTKRSENFYQRHPRQRIYHIPCLRYHADPGAGADPPPRSRKGSREIGAAPA